jgi:beta-1,4-mannosyltransferase
LLIIPKYEVVLIQNPPCIPALISTLVVSLFRWNSIWVDWHNLGFTMFKYDSNIARFSKLLERNLAKFCSVHFCVSNALGEWLLKEFNISAKVLYDRPSKRFDKSQISIQSRHELFLKLNLIDSELFQSDLSHSSTSFKEGSYTIQTYTDQNGQTLMREDSTRIVFSSTSWTEDEDFHLLLKALSKLDKILRANLNKYGPNKYQSSKVLIVITGKGPLKEEFLNEYNQIAPNLKMVAVVTPWLEPDEYPKIIKCSDIGICLHGSTSGLDLPMKVIYIFHLYINCPDLIIISIFKVLDMLGSGLPAICLNYPAIKELVTDKEDGYLFKQIVLSDENYLTQLNIDTIDSEFNSFPELFDCLVKVLCLSKSQSTLSSLRKNVQIKPLSSWESTWNSVIYPLINKEKEVKEEKDD